MVPDKVFVPTSEIVPAKLKLLVTFAPSAFKIANVAPAEIVADPLPSADAFEIFNVPALIAVPPLYVFAADNVSAPEPVFVSEFAPLMIPLNVRTSATLPILIIPEPVN